jgi:hypothetical protein
MDYREFPLSCDGHKSPWTFVIRAWLVGFVATVIVFNAQSDLCPAVISYLGPRLGMRSMIITRYSFGFWASKLIILLNAVTCIGVSMPTVNEELSELGILVASHQYHCWWRNLVRCCGWQTAFGSCYHPCSHGVRNSPQDFLCKTNIYPSSSLITPSVIKQSISMTDTDRPSLSSPLSLC